MDDYLKGIVTPPPDQDPHGEKGNKIAMERMFCLAENKTGLLITKTWISDTELKRRFRIAVEKWRCDRPWNKVRDILLYGEPKE